MHQLHLGHMESLGSGPLYNSLFLMAKHLQILLLAEVSCQTRERETQSLRKLKSLRSLREEGTGSGVSAIWRVCRTKGPLTSPADTFRPYVLFHQHSTFKCLPPQVKEMALPRVTAFPARCYPNMDFSPTWHTLPQVTDQCLYFSRGSLPVTSIHF